MAEQDAVARELYRADPGEFVGLRDRRAAEARERGDDHLARTIARWRKPTTAAWAVNLLVAAEPGRLDELVELGEQLRRAQRELRGGDIGALAQRRSQMLRELTDRAVSLARQAGRAVGEQPRAQIEATMTAALSDPGSARAVRAGTLDRPLEFSGFGLDELSVEAMWRAGRSDEDGATRSHSRTSAGAGRSGESKDSARSRRSATRSAASDRSRALERLRTERDRAASEVNSAAEELDRAERDRQEAEARRADVARELDRADRRLREAARVETRARERRDQAQRSRDELDERLRRGGSS